MSSIDSEDENLLWNEILARRRRTRLIGVIATIGLTGEPQSGEALRPEPGSPFLGSSQ